MNQQEFINDLSKRLKRLPKEDFDDAVTYYKEYFLDAGIDSEQDVTALVGMPVDVSRRILEECTDKQMEIQKQEGGVKNTAKSVWLVILGIFAAPIALPLAIATAALLIAIIAVILAVFIAALASGFSFFLSGLTAIPGIFWADSAGQAFIIAGIALLCIALGIILCLVFWKLGGLLIRLIVKLFKQMISRKKVA